MNQDEYEKEQDLVFKQNLRLRRTLHGHDAEVLTRLLRDRGVHTHVIGDNNGVHIKLVGQEAFRLIQSLESE